MERKVSYINENLSEFDKELNEGWDILTAVALDRSIGISDATLGKLFRKHCEKLTEREKLQVLEKLSKSVN